MRYQGVVLTRGRFSAKVQIDGRSISLGTWADARAAGIARDRAALFFGQEPPNDLPEARTLGAASPERLRELARAEWKAGRGAAYAGVSRTKDDRFLAFVTIDGRFRSAGIYDTERQAALARDRAVLHHELGCALNFPDAARELGPLSADALKLECKLRGKARSTSRYLGVTYVANNRNWAAWTPGTPTRFIGAFEREEDAALAHDRVAAAELGPDATLNFPDSTPATIEAMRRWARSLRKRRHKHRYQGVRRDWNKDTFCWVAAITFERRTHSLGNWRTEREAVIAWDRAALHFRPDDALLNLPRVSRKLGPASPAELSEEAHRLFKETTTSEYRGVNWSKVEQGLGCEDPTRARVHPPRNLRRPRARCRCLRSRGGAFAQKAGEAELRIEPPSRLRTDLANGTMFGRGFNAEMLRIVGRIALDRSPLDLRAVLSSLRAAVASVFEQRDRSDDAGDHVSCDLLDALNERRKQTPSLRRCHVVEENAARVEVVLQVRGANAPLDLFRLRRADRKKRRARCRARRRRARIDLLQQLHGLEKLLERELACR